MFFIVYINGCLPYVDILIDPKNDQAMSFETKAKAERYAGNNCAWEYQIIEFN